MKNLFNKSNLYKLLLIIPFFVILIHTSYLQFFLGNSLLVESFTLVQRNKTIQPPRGLITDANGNILADNKIVYDLFLKFSDEMESKYNKFSSYLNSLGYQVKAIPEKLNQNLKLLDSITADKISAIQELIDDNSELYLESRLVRNYLYPEQFSHIIGYTGFVDEGYDQDIYSPNDQIGQYRVEEIYENYLKGSKGNLNKITDSGILVEPTPGDNIILTANLDWQNKLYSLLQKYESLYNSASGAAVIMDIKSGQLKALVSYPGFDANAFVKGISSDDFLAIESNRSKPLLDKVITTASTPGSIFKLVTAYSLLENGVISQNTKALSTGCIDLGSYNFCEYGKLAYGYLDITSALARSSNIFFCELTLSMQKTNTLQNFYNSLSKLPFGKETGIEILSEANGQIDSPDHKLERTSESWYDGDTCNMAIGQGATQLTPLQMTVYVSALFNGGKILKPQIIEKISSSFGTQYESITETVNNIDLKDLTRDLIHTGMKKAATSTEGVLYYFLKDYPEFNLYVKTGSAETFESSNGVTQEQTNSWITGTFDSNGNTYAFTFFQLYGGGGYYITPMLSEFLNLIK